MKFIPNEFCDPHKALGLSPDAPMLVALSGGADSSALLHIMCLCREIVPFRLCAAHVNHNIRTEKYSNEADRDESFCREMCKRMNVELFVLNADVPSLARERGESTETVARDVRYSFFRQIMHKEGINVLLTAHNASDNLETQIFNLCRGCTIKGISGIPRSRPLDRDGACVFRPLLDMSKSDILTYCENLSIEYVTDSTNFEQDYTRNRIRHKVIPELENMFGALSSASSRLASTAAEDDEFITSRAAEILSSLPSSDIPLDVLESLHPALKRRIICLAYAELEKKDSHITASDKSSPDSTSACRLETVHIRSILSLASGAVPHSSVSLPGRICAKIEHGALIFSNEILPSEQPAACEYNIKLSDGINIIPHTDTAVVISDGADTAQVININGEIYKLYTSAHIKNAKILPLYARTRREGDIIHTRGMTKSIKKLHCEKKLPLCERHSLPLITDGDGRILYAPKCAVSDIAAEDCKPLDILIYKIERTAL